jgi:TATA-box binding protein (TBP) (component of TFIID and TFIIIB)
MNIKQIYEKYKNFNIDTNIDDILALQCDPQFQIITVDMSKINDDLENIKNNLFYQNIINELQPQLFPKNIYISTMTVTCTINNLKFNCENIAKYVDLSYDNVEKIICAIEEHRKKDEKLDIKNIINRSLPSKKKIKKNKKGKKEKKVFYNQVSMDVNVKSKIKGPVHVKLFINGSIQMTGCQTTEDIYETIYTIINIFKTEKYILDYKTNEIIEKPFVSNKDSLDFNNISSLKINMINSNFKIPFSMNLSKLYKLMLDKGVKCIYDKINHSCVNIKYMHIGKEISIFVFEKGSIVITGARNGEQINSAYEFINKFLLINYKSIVKKENSVIEHMNFKIKS